MKKLFFSLTLAGAVALALALPSAALAAPGQARGHFGGGQAVVRGGGYGHPFGPRVVPYYRGYRGFAYRSILVRWRLGLLRLCVSVRGAGRRGDGRTATGNRAEDGTGLCRRVLCGRGRRFQRPLPAPGSDARRSSHRGAAAWIPAADDRPVHPAGPHDRFQGRADAGAGVAVSQRMVRHPSPDELRGRMPRPHESGQSRPVPISMRFSANSCMSPSAFNCADALWIA